MNRNKPKSVASLLATVAFATLAMQASAAEDIRTGVICPDEPGRSGDPASAEKGCRPEAEPGKPEAEPGNWVTYNGTYKSWHYSPLDKINTKNVGKLTEAWSHSASRARRGMQSMPLAIDGVLYYTGPYNQVYALDGATGQMLWTYKQKLNEDLVARQTHGPYNRGIAAAYGNIIIGTLDGKLAAIDMKTGKSGWETKLIDSEKLTVGFTGAPMLVKDKIIIGAQGGEWPYRGPIFGVDAKTGKKVWEFLTVGGNDGTAVDRRDTWGNDSWKVGGGGGWMAGAYDAETNIVWWGTGQSGASVRLGRADWKTKGPRPGDNLYTTSVLLLDPDTGALKAYHQELPHDAWDFDSSLGGFMFVGTDGKKYVVHPNKGGFIFVYDRQGKCGQRLQGRRQHQLRPGHQARMANWWAAATWPRASTKIFARQSRAARATTRGPTAPRPACSTSRLRVVHGPYGAEGRAGHRTRGAVVHRRRLQFTVPRGEKSMRGHIRARDPASGKVKFEIAYPGATPHSSLLSTAGGVLFVPRSRWHAHRV